MQVGRIIYFIIKWVPMSMLVKVYAYDNQLWSNMKYHVVSNYLLEEGSL